MTSYVFNVARRDWTSNGGTGSASPILPEWNSPTGTWRMLWLGGGGAANGLAATGAEDAETLGDIALGGLLSGYEFNGSGYTQGGFTFPLGAVWDYDTATNKAEICVGTITTFGGGTGSVGFGTGGHDKITDIVIYWDKVPGSPLLGVPIVRFDLGATYIPQGAVMTLNWSGGEIVEIG